jgi:di/tricarboxylate transporter
VTFEQQALLALFAVFFVLLLWGRWRYDFVAFAVLVAAVLAGLVEPARAFEGFGHPAVVIIALVLLLSRGLTNSGAVEALARSLASADRPVSLHVAAMASVGAALSAVINNVAALALLMTVDIEAARKAGRPAGRTLMALSFATILGGMTTLIGTPPNIVIAQFREQALGEPFSMFDFTPVGLIVAVAGIAFVALAGWRLVPASGRQAAGQMNGHMNGQAGGAGGDDDSSSLFLVEARPSAKSPVIGQKVGSLYEEASASDIVILGLVRRGKRLPGFSRDVEIRPSDLLVLEGEPRQIEELMGRLKLAAPNPGARRKLTDPALAMQEMIVPDGARIAGRSAAQLRLQSRYGIGLVGVSRQGARLRERLLHLAIRPGDLLLMAGTPERLAEASARLGALPLAGRATSVLQRGKAAAAVAVFAAAVALAAAGVAPLAILLAACILAYAAIGLLSGSEVYEAVEWKVLVLLASLIPLAGALEENGVSAMLAGGLVDGMAGWPAWTVLLALMVVTMTLSDFLNNVATALVAAPVGLEVASRLGVSPDPFLIGIAVAASCAFLTPVGHKNNTIIMGPGGYRFGDYWRMGLPLEIIVIAVSLPAILYFWPF